MAEPWNDRRVLVTGAAGFIGSHLVERLLTEGADVRVFVRYVSSGTVGPLQERLAHIDVHRGDVRDPEAVERALDGRQVVFHLAALIGIPYSYESPRDVVDTNVGGTLNVLQAARRQHVDLTLCMSTSEIYGSPDRTPIGEDAPLRPQSPYAATKVGADMLGQSFHRSFGLPVTLARPFNVYGPRQSPRAIVPTLLGQVLAGGPIRVGALEPVRDLTFVEDTVDGLLRIAAWSDAPGRTVQLGSGTGVSVGELASLAAQVVGRELSIEVEHGRVRPGASEIDRLVCDASLARDRLGWRARIGLRDGLKRSAAWLAEHPPARPPHEYAV